MITLLGDLGGILDLFMVFGTFITLNTVKGAFARSLLGEAYQVQGYLEDQSEFYKSEKAGKCLQSLSKGSKNIESIEGDEIHLTGEDDSSQEEDKDKS